MRKTSHKRRFDLALAIWLTVAGGVAGVLLPLMVVLLAVDVGNHRPPAKQVV